MTVYKYYAVIEEDKVDQSGSYIVSFPDLDNVFTDGETLEEAEYNAKDVLETMLTMMEEDGDPIAKPSSKRAIMRKAPADSKVVLVEVDTSSNLVSM